MRLSTITCIILPFEWNNELVALCFTRGNKKRWCITHDLSSGYVYTHFLVSENFQTLSRFTVIFYNLRRNCFSIFLKVFENDSVAIFVTCRTEQPRKSKYTIHFVTKKNFLKCSLVAVSGIPDGRIATKIMYRKGSGRHNDYNDLI